MLAKVGTIEIVSLVARAMKKEFFIVLSYDYKLARMTASSAANRCSDIV